MWEFVEVHHTELTWGVWHALVILSREGVAEAFWLKFSESETEPGLQEVCDAGQALALRKTAEEAENQGGAE